MAGLLQLRGVAGQAAVLRYVAEEGTSRENGEDQETASVRRCAAQGKVPNDGPDDLLRA